MKSAAHLPPKFYPAVAASLAIHAAGWVALTAWTPRSFVSQSQFARPRQVIVLTLVASPPSSDQVVAVKVPVPTGRFDEPVSLPVAAQQRTPPPADRGTEPLAGDEVSATRWSSRLQRDAEDGIPERPPAESPRLAMFLPRQSTLAQNPVRATVPLPSSLGNSDETPPDLSHNPPPVYPSIAIQRRWEGTVVLRLAIDRRGQITDLEVARTSGHAVLDDAAVRAVRDWRATPARRAGQPVATVELLPVRFEL